MNRAPRASRSFGEAVRHQAFWFRDRLKGGAVARHLRDLEDHAADPSRAEGRTAERLDGLLRHASATTAFYRDFAGVPLEDHPVIAKRTIKERFEDFMSSGFRRNALVPMTTSGSYGTPFTFYLSREKKARQWAEILFFGRWAGYEPGTRYGYLSAVTNSRASDLFQNRVLLDPLSLDPGGLEEHIRRLQDRRVEVLLGYVSVVHAMARYLRMNPDSGAGLSLRGVITMSEPISPSIRDVCERAFGCRVMSRYSMQEFGIVAHQCPTGDQHHLTPGGYVIELLDPAGDWPVERGKAGRVVITDVFSHSMPLIRYDTGDLAVGGKRCSCGAEVPVFARIDGRLVETIYHPNGAKLSPYVINHAMRDVPHVLQYQFAQTGRREYHLAIVRLPGFREESLIRDRLGEILGPEADLTIRHVTSIAPLPSGKRPYILNRWKVTPASGGEPIPTSRG